MEIPQLPEGNVHFPQKTQFDRRKQEYGEGLFLCFRAAPGAFAGQFLVYPNPGDYFYIEKSYFNI